MSFCSDALDFFKVIILIEYKIARTFRALDETKTHALIYLRNLNTNRLISGLHKTIKTFIAFRSIVIPVFGTSWNFGWNLFAFSIVKIVVFFAQRALVR